MLDDDYVSNASTPINFYSDDIKILKERLNAIGNKDGSGYMISLGVVKVMNDTISLMEKMTIHMSELQAKVSKLKK